MEEPHVITGLWHTLWPHGHVRDSVTCKNGIWIWRTRSSTIYLASALHKLPRTRNQPQKKFLSEKTLSSLILECIGSWHLVCSFVFVSPFLPCVFWGKQYEEWRLERDFKILLQKTKKSFHLAHLHLQGINRTQEESPRSSIARLEFRRHYSVLQGTLAITIVHVLSDFEL